MLRKKALYPKLRLMLVAGKKDAGQRTVSELALLAFQGGVSALQLREKSLDDNQFYDQALELRALSKEHNKLFIINNRVDIALAVDADGVHLGESDLNVATAAKLLSKDKIIGYSASSAVKAKEAILKGADYLGVGALYPSPSKPEAKQIDADTISSIIALKWPTVGIGGITTENAHLAWAYGFNGLALISALAQAQDPTQAAKKILAGCI
ncbi:MAG: thiamine phosphate synthase [Deltaproteobacteria bacterium]|jgi:thiamine-phosphate pyrophosphorylase|nr:thiamine phosphate synthase [Deltaproteobacteria bacterium]